MKARNLKLVGIVVLTGLVACVVTYAGKEEGKKVSLPDAAKSAISARYPQAVIGKTRMEKEGLKVYEVELKQNDQEFEITVAPDGTIVEVGTELTAEKLPPAVAEAFAKVAKGTKIKEVDQEVTYAVVTLVKLLNEPKTTYEAEVTIDGKKCEVKVAADGTILEQKVKEGDEGKDEDDKHDEGGQKVSIDQVPAAVKATILKEAEGGTIKKIESKTENGKTTYEAEVLINGKEVEIKVAADGILLGKKAEDADDNDSNDKK
jgi:uncharacterized membrane protein YkoI